MFCKHGNVGGVCANADSSDIERFRWIQLQAISASALTGLALKADGTVVAWGANGSGQATVPNGLCNVIAVSAGGLFSMALESNGTVVVGATTVRGNPAFQVV